MRIEEAVQLPEIEAFCNYVESVHMIHKCLDTGVAIYLNGSRFALIPYEEILAMRYPHYMEIILPSIRKAGIATGRMEIIDQMKEIIDN